jgi:hypothetical protein
MYVLTCEKRCIMTTVCTKINCSNLWCIPDAQRNFITLCEECSYFVVLIVGFVNPRELLSNFDTSWPYVCRFILVTLLVLTTNCSLSWPPTRTIAYHVNLIFCTKNRHCFVWKLITWKRLKDSCRSLAVLCIVLLRLSSDISASCCHNTTAGTNVPKAAC